MAFSKSLVAAVVVAVHSFSVSASILSDASTITAAPAVPTDALAARQVAGDPGTPILSTLHYPYTALPYQVYPFQVLRGPQFGFNQCNSTTESQDSNCQTLIFNGPDDFCLWGSPITDGAIGDIEARVVAWCTKPGHGTRVIPAGSITGLQWMKTPGYIQVVGFFNNNGIGLATNDTGGELDPHGADLQGNPLGGMVYSNGTADAQGGELTQVFNWNTFVGSGTFCFKACYNSITEPDYCENRYDLVGCDYNMPNQAQNGVFESCEGDVQDPVGTYTSNGQTITWSMPDPLNTPPPYTPRIPASSNCQTFSSEQLFAGAPSATFATASGASGSAGGSAAPTGGASGTSKPTGGSGSSKPSQSGTGSGAVPVVSMANPAIVVIPAVAALVGAIGVLL